MLALAHRSARTVSPGARAVYTPYRGGARDSYAVMPCPSPAIPVNIRSSAIADVPWQPVRSSVEGPQTKDLGSNETQTGPLKGVSLRAPVGQRQPARIRAAVSGPDCAARRACLRRVQRAATVQETRQRARHDHKRRGRLPVGCRACHRDGNAGNRLQAPRAHRSDPATARDAPRLDLAEPPTPTSPPTVSDR